MLARVLGVALLLLATLLAPSAFAEPLGEAVAAGAGGSTTATRAYVALGASDAVGVGAADPLREGWVPRLGTGLGASWRTVNLGVSGTLLDGALRDQLPSAVAADPDLVTVWLAVNDFNALVPLASYGAQLDLLLRTLREQTHARVLVGNVPDVSRVPNYIQTEIPPFLIRWQVQRWNATIAAVVAANGATLVDLAPYGLEMAQHPEYVSADGFHPSSAGYARLAELFTQVAAATG